MKALLRLQAVVAWRAVSNWMLLALVGLIVFGVLLGDSWAEGTRAGVLAIAMPMVAMGMAETFDALDVMRWRAPIPRSRVLAAHFLFWAAVCAPLVACAAASRTGEAMGAVLAFADAMIVALAGAATVPVAQNWRRNRTFESAMRLIGLVLTVAGLAVWSIALSWNHPSASGLAPGIAALCIAGTVGARCYFVEERLPTTTGVTEPRDLAPARRTPRTPVASQRNALPNYGWLIANAVIAIVAQFIPAIHSTKVPPVSALLLIGAAVGIGAASLSSCRWLFAGPMDRGRLFRRCFVPAVALLALGVTIRSVVEELRPDRTEFFDTFHPSAPSVHHRDAIVLGHVLDVRDGYYCPPEIPFMAERVREQLWTLYSLDVSSENVEASIRRGWPASGRNEGDMSPSSQEAVFDAMDRVRDDLAEEIVAADRLRIAVGACGVLLVWLLMLRAQLIGFRRYWAVIGLWLVGCALAFAPQFAPHSRLAETVASAGHALFAFIHDVSLPVAALGFVAVALLLWKICERAFRRLDITDLPPATMAEWRRSRSA